MNDRTPASGDAWQVLVLGPTDVEPLVPGFAAPSLSAIQRSLLARLALARPAFVDVDALIDAIWGHGPPRTARAALQNQVSRVRAALGAAAVESGHGGYRLALTTDVDAVSEVFDSATMPGWTAVDPPTASLFDHIDRAVRRFRGPAFHDLHDDPVVEAARRRLDEVRRALENQRLELALRTGRLGWALPESERLVGDSPYDEHRWVQLARALDLAGRRGDALATFDRARYALRDGLGLDPGPVLTMGERAILGLAELSTSRSTAPCVGRDDVVERIAAVAGGGGRVGVVGEEGMGRTRVVAEVARRLRASGVRVATTQCSNAPATPVSVLLELAEQLGIALDQVRGAIDGFVAAVTRATSHGPVVLVVDDIHRAGPSSRAALDAVASSGVGLVWSAIEHVDEAPFDTDSIGDVVRLDPLPADAVAELATERTGTPRRSDDEYVAWLTAMSGGNPVFLEALLDDPTTLDRWADEGAGVGTGWLQLADLVRARIDRLGIATRTAVEVAAVCGPQFPAVTLDAMVPPSGIAAAVAAGLLEHVDGGTLRFHHGAVHRVVYGDVAPGRRLELHHAIGERMAAAGLPASLVAHHAIAATELDPRGAFEAACAAAFEASRVGAHRDAAGWYERAHDAAEALGPHGRLERVRALIGRGDALRLAGHPDQEEVLFLAADAAIREDDPTLLADAAFAVLQLGATTESGGANERAVALSEIALDRARTPDDRARVAAAASLAQSMSGRPAACRELFLQAERDAESASVRRSVLPFAYMALGLPEDLERREALAAELLELARHDRDPVARFEALHLAFSATLQRGDGRRLRSALAAMLDLVEQVGDVGRRWQLLYGLAAVAHLDDELDRSERLAEDALTLFAPVSASRAVSAFGGQLLAIRLAQGRLAELEDTFASMVADQPAVPAWHAALALATVGTDPDRARQEARAALRHAPADFLWLATHVIGGRAAAALSDAPVIEDYIERLAPWSGRVCWQGTCSYGPVDTTLAMLHAAAGRRADADRHVEAARELASRLMAPVFLRDLDEWFMAMGR